MSVLRSSRIWLDTIAPARLSDPKSGIPLGPGDGARGYAQDLVGAVAAGTRILVRTITTAIVTSPPVTTWGYGYFLRASNGAAIYFMMRHWVNYESTDASTPWSYTWTGQLAIHSGEGLGIWTATPATMYTTGHGASLQVET